MAGDENIIYAKNCLNERFNVSKTNEPNSQRDDAIPGIKNCCRIEGVSIIQPSQTELIRFERLTIHVPQS